MSEYTIVRCKICGKTFRVYMHKCVQGDPSCCDKCNKESEEGKTTGWQKG